MNKVVYHCIECGHNSLNEDEAKEHLKIRGIWHVSMKSIFNPDTEMYENYYKDENVGFESEDKDENED